MGQNNWSRKCQAMPKISRINSGLLFLLFLTLIILIAYLLLPQSLGGYWGVPMTSNAYLPDLGFDSELATVNSRPVIAYVVLINVISTTLNTEPLATSHIMGLLSVLFVILSYLLLLHVLPAGNKAKMAVLGIFPIFYIAWYAPALLSGYVLGPAMILSFSALFCILYQHRYKSQNHIAIFLVLLISLGALGVFWHTLFTATFLLIVSFTAVTAIPGILRKEKLVVNWYLVALIIAIFIVAWLYLRGPQLAFILQNLNLSFDFASLFAKGSFIGEYGFKYAFPVACAGKVRYAAYILVYVTMGLVAINYFRRVFKKDSVMSSEVSLAYSLVLTFLISDIVFQLLYFIATGTVGPRILITFSYPFMLIYLNSSVGQQASFVSKLNFKKFLTVFLVIAVILTSASSLYSYVKEDPARNLNEEMYKSSFFWIAEHTAAERVLSDAPTSGQYQLLYAYHNIFEHQRIAMSSITYSQYERVMNLTYENSPNSLLALNAKLYEEHLIFGALQAWNRFEPISPEYISRNPQLNIIYNDGRILLAQ